MTPIENNLSLDRTFAAAILFGRGTLAFRSAMDRFVIRQNIERYRALLQREPDEKRRAMLERLLSEETMKLAQIERPDGDGPDKKPD